MRMIETCSCSSIRTVRGRRRRSWAYPISVLVLIHGADSRLHPAAVRRADEQSRREALFLLKANGASTKGPKGSKSTKAPKSSKAPKASSKGGLTLIQQPEDPPLPNAPDDNPGLPPNDSSMPPPSVGWNGVPGLPVIPTKPTEPPPEPEPEPKTKHHSNVLLRDFTETVSRASNAAAANQHQPVTRQATGPCVLNENGFYGEAIGSIFEVRHGYQIIVANGTTEQDVFQVLTPQLDTVIAEELLPYLFDCGNGRRLRNLQTNDTNVPRITGLSRLQTDVAISNEATTCIGAAADLPCWVIVGSLFVFGENFFTSRQVELVVDRALKLLMQSDTLNGLVPGVEDVQFVDDGFQTVNPIPTPAPTFPRPTVQPTTRSPNLPPITPQPSSAPVTAAPSAAPLPTSLGSPTTQPPRTAPTPVLPFPPTIPSGTPSPTPATATTPSVPSGSGTTPTAGTPTSGQTPSAPQAPTPPTSTEPQGIDRVQWWGWLLVGIGAALLLLGAFICFRGFGATAGGAKSGQSQATDDDEYIPPGGGEDSYVPPGTDDAFNADANDAYEQPEAFGEEEEGTGEYEEGEEEEYTEGEGTYEDEEEYTEGEEYEEGEGSYEEEEYEEGQEYEEGDYDEEYDDEDGESYEEEESYYEEETVAGESQDGMEEYTHNNNNNTNQSGGWGTGYQ